MLRRLFNGFLETVVQGQSESAMCPSPFTKQETLSLGWLTNVSPCFPVKSSRISILNEPHDFFDALVDGCANAKERIYLVSLYIGNGSLEKKLVNSLLENDNFRSGKLKISILLDYMRGSRGEVNSRTILQPLLKAGEDRCRVSLYHTPVFRGLLKKLFSNRWKELFGVQHMKLYIFDDTLLISGANLSQDYFTNRQDRYFLIHDKNLCDFYVELVKRVEKFSLVLDQCDNVNVNPDWNLSPFGGDKAEFITRANSLVEELMTKMRKEKNTNIESGFDTWIFPLVQMGQLNVTQDSVVTERLFREAPVGSQLCIATGYFNLTSGYTENLKHSQGQCQVLMAHPQANGFMGAKGLAGGIPYAYSLISRQFEKEFVEVNQRNRLVLLEYLREKWTYHGKGLWYYAPGARYPSLSLIGSPNFGERSVKRDLETQLAIVTENDALSCQLHNEWTRLCQYAHPADTKRNVPTWVFVFVFFFRQFF